MTMNLMLATFAGAFIFPYLLRLCVGPLLEKFGPIGGWIFAGFVVGTAWTLNHGVGMIFQSGSAWVDMAWAAGFGLWAASAFSGDSIGKSIPTFVNSIIVGTLGGFLLSCFLK